MSTAVIQVPFELVQKWQEIVDVIAEIIHVPSALVMKVEPPNIKVFVSSVSNSNPYERDELAPLNTGLYCETVMKTRQSLLVPDALRDEEWKSNPDIKLGMISYLGFPVTWPDGQIFGRICVLDRKENSYSELYRKLVLQCRDVLEADLRALARLSGELTRSEAYLEEAQRLSHAIAHEINQPLAALVTQGRACLRWLAHEPPNLGEGRRSVEAMIDSGVRAAEVISRLRAMMTKSPPHRDLLNINDAILAVIALVGAEAQRNRVLLRTELSSDLPLVLGDRIQLQQVILNLIMNAIEAMRGIDQTQRKVLVVSRKDESKGALVEVQDSGAGLEGLALDRLFDAFYTTKADGMGIGLAVSRTIIESHGGQLRALPNVPQGAVFQFQLPTSGN